MMAEMTDKQRRWFAGVFDALATVEFIEDQGPNKRYKVMRVQIGPVKESVANRLVDYLGNGWMNHGDTFELRGMAACRGLFIEIWGDITLDTRKMINAELRKAKGQ